MPEKIKAGVIGAGFIGPAHVEAIRRLGFVDVIALATSREETAKSKAKQLCIPKAYGNWQDLIEDDEVQVVQITSPNHLHFPQAKAAIEAGKHVVCDKPLATNSEESGQLLKLAKQKKVVHAVTFNHRYFPLVQQCQSLIKKGFLGCSLYLIQGGFLQDWLLFDTDYNWRVEASSAGRLRAVGDLGTHWMDIIEFVTGLKIESVLADLATFIPTRKKPTGGAETFTGKGRQGSAGLEEIKIDTEDLALVLFKFSGSAARGIMTVSEVTAGRKSRLFFEIYGSERSLAWDEERANELWIGNRDEPNQILPKDPSLLEKDVAKYARYPGGHGEGFPDSHTQCNREIYEYIRDEKYRKGVKPAFPTFEEGHRQEVLCDSILKSAREGKWIKIEE